MSRHPIVEVLATWERIATFMEEQEEHKAAQCIRAMLSDVRGPLDDLATDAVGRRHGGVLFRAGFLNRARHEVRPAARGADAHDLTI
jgi:hypothetical protein